MSNRKEAVDILHEMHACTPGVLFHQLDEMQQGTGFALAFLVKADGKVIAGDLAREMKVSTARIATLLNKMEKNGLVTRRTSKEDARRTIVEITPAGIARADEIREQILQKIDLLIDKVGEEELKEFIRISQKMKKALED